MRVVAAPAKLNFFLHITGRRDDGYHLLESLAGFTRFGDSLEIEPADRLTLEITGPYAPQLQQGQENNLVMQAARRMAQRAGKPAGARLRLTKRIPMGAGLGGGSSDAAAALAALAGLWNVDVSREEMLAMALSLGSDVPVCLAQRWSWVAGTGDVVTPVEASVHGWVVLVNPSVALLTADVYRRYAGDSAGAYTAPRRVERRIGSLQELVQLMQATHNDLLPPALALMPSIQAVLDAVADCEGCLIARMSGSGATCYGVFADEAAAQAAAARLRNAMPGAWVLASMLQP
jgi:4-diphosphocytidyl-2-C-methyl-D-erythritol kinase